MAFAMNSGRMPGKTPLEARRAGIQAGPHWQKKATGASVDR
jgi:hypothetical protein